MASPPRYHLLAHHYERCFAQHGDTAKGLDWPDEADLRLRYAVMLDMLPPAGSARTSLLDFGCGTGQMLQFMQETDRWSHVDYHGLDLSPAFIELCRAKFPGVPFTALDAIARPDAVPRVDYTVINGVFTVKRELQDDEMWAMVQSLLRAVWPHTRHALSFNVMSTRVDWRRDDLFHLPMDQLAAFLTTELSRHFTIRHDYGLYEYTCTVRRAPRK